jgi:hypothetical protein
MRRLLLPLALLFALVSCASGDASGGGRPADVARPEIHIGIAGGTVFFGSGSNIPVTLDIEVTNRANVPITLREVEVSSHGMMQWSLRTRRQHYKETLGPGETKKVTLYTNASSSSRYPQEPMSLRSFVHFEVNGKFFREIVFTRG